MQISVTGRHMVVTEALRDYAHDRIAHAFAAYPRIVGAHLILAIEKHRHSAELVAQGPHHLRVEAKAESPDMYASIADAVDKTAKQIERQLDKWQDHKAREPLSHLEARSTDAGSAGS
ncbi:MAG: ribosome-associated translation inhibitor RaiA [Kiritimatiellaeota bacterium]|nr:ribosome-associated translation inhibitor RaiA [Kiritimatiellota bacterium]